METRANYVLVGSFVLALIAAEFAFVLWLARVDFEHEPKIYLTYFRGSVSGLQLGSEVQYRGVPVGRLTGAALIVEGLLLKPGTALLAGAVLFIVGVIIQSDIRHQETH